MQLALRLHDAENAEQGIRNGEPGADDGMEDDMDVDNMTYEQMLELGEQIGDVRLEQWASRADAVIARLPTSVLNAASSAQQRRAAGAAASGTPRTAEARAETDAGARGTSETCLVCQCDYEDGDRIMHPPCRHQYHADCIRQWLRRNNTCPVCKASVEDGGREVAGDDRGSGRASPRL